MTRRALTLLELLVAMALSLLLIYGMAAFFVHVSDTIKDGRAIVEMGGDIRNAVRQLRDDLHSVTAAGRPPLNPSSAAGYFEIIDGTAHDMDVDADGVTDTNATMQGDTDDILSFTIRSSGTPFTGWRFDATNGPQPVTSDLAEVVWFTTFKDTNGNGTWDAFDEPRFLVRRQLLILPNLTLATAGQPQDFFQDNDVSARFDSANNRWLANSLSDLTQRENRFIHLDLDFSDGSQNGLRAADAIQPAAYMPNPVQLRVGSPASLQVYTLQGDKLGEDIVLPNLLAFDARVYDPAAPLYGDDSADPQAALQPGDPGFVTAYNLNPSNAVGWGAYVDLHYNRTLGSLTLSTPFAGLPDARSASGGFASYDTWSTFYERDGLDQFADGKTDAAFDGLDNAPFADGVDDGGEFETSPPYPVKLRGIQVRIRMYEPGTRQTRQATVVSDF